jgi:hypothetical protein
MKTNQANTHLSHPNECRYALRRGVHYWALVFEGREAIFKHELGALYVAFLLLNPPKEPLHAVALALKAREADGKPAGPDEVLEERSMGLEDAAAVRALWRRQRELERVLADRLAIEPVKAEALRELEEVTEYLRKSPWLSRHGADRCVKAVVRRSGVSTPTWPVPWTPRASLTRCCRRSPCTWGRICWLPQAGVAGARGRGWPASQRGASPMSRRPAWPGAPEKACYSSNSFCGPIQDEVKEKDHVMKNLTSHAVCAALAAVAAIAVCGCASPRPLKGGKAVTTCKPAGVIEQTLVQGENPSQASKQSQESVKVRSYTLPAGSRLEEARVQAVPAGVPLTNVQTVVLSAPMPVIEREETHARTELGAAQKDTARELGAKLASLKGIVWVGVGLFVFGLASLVWPPLKAIIGSVTTSAALMLGGLALMVLPSLIVGNELLILGGVVLAVGGWFLAHRHGQLRGMVAASSQKPSGNQ